MEQIEITVKLNESIEKALKKLEELGYKNIRESDIYDIYMRDLKVKKQEWKKITYKNKKYVNNQVISEEKVNVNCDDLKKAKELFEYLKFEKLIEVKYHVIVMAKDGIELAFQEVENLGTLIEYENLNDFCNKTIEEIQVEKMRMYNFIKKLGINIGEDFDIKKAWNLIEKKYLKK